MSKFVFILYGLICFFALPVCGVVFDFETGTEGWVSSTSPGESGIHAVTTTTQAYSNQHSLALSTHLDYANTNLRAGVVSVMCPDNMNGQSVEAWVRPATGMTGDPSRPNGIQLFAKDQNYKSQMSVWKNIGTEIPENQWTKLVLIPTATTNQTIGDSDAGFDPERILLIGVKLGVGGYSAVSVLSTCSVDFVTADIVPLVVPESDHLFDFDLLTPDQQREQPFGYGPYWTVDPAWGADAWASNDITVANGALVVTNACFSLGAPNQSGQKGYLGVELKPNLDINNKDNRIIRAEIKLSPYMGPDMLASIFVFDQRDGRPQDGGGHRWYRSMDTRVGGKGWNELVFDLGNSTHFNTNDVALSPSDITETSLKNILKIGIQFYSNIEYSGTVTVDNVTIGGVEILTNHTNLNQGFVKRNGSAFELDGQPYRFAGNNSYYLFYKSHFMIDDLMETMQTNGIEVLRTWGFSDGTAPYAKDGDGEANGNEGCAFQPEQGLFHEPTFVNFDYVLKSAGEHGVRLIVPLVNYWSDVDNTNDYQNAYGGMAQYLDWCGIELQYGEDGKLQNKSAFYTNETVKSAYKAYVTHMLKRTNTLTGIAYKDDPTILAWELANEPRGQNGGTCNALHAWIAEMSAHLRSLDTNHLIGIGDEGFLNDAGSSDSYYNGYFGVDWEQNLALDTIDFGTVHLYPDHWEKDLEWAREWITNHVARANAIGKPVLFEEFGIRTNTAAHRDLVYLEWTELFERDGGLGADGTLVWMIAGQVNGSNEQHTALGDGFYYSDYDGFTFWEPSSTMHIIRRHAARMKGETPSHHLLVATFSDGGVIHPSGTTPVDAGSSTGFVIQASSWFHIADIQTNGATIGESFGLSSNVYIWSNVTADGILHTEFAANLATNYTPEWWLAQHGWTNDFDAAAMSDNDGDNIPTWAEYQADTIPTNPNSALTIRLIPRTNENIGIEWQGGIDAWQTLESRTGLGAADPQWNAVFTNKPPTSVTNKFSHEGITNRTRYYRLRAWR